MREVIHIIGGGTVTHVRPHLAIASPAYGDTARTIAEDSDARTKYNIMCKPCNALYYVREILGIKGHTITWMSL
jgi:hypothetical protein